MTDSLAPLRRDIADACRVIAARDLAPGFLGHISLRVDATTLLVRCRGPQERGLAWTEPEDIRLVDIAGNAGSPGELDGGYAPPNELPLHIEVLRARRDVQAVLHAHPPATVAADLAGLEIRPIVGAFDIPGAKLAAGGVPVYPRGVLVRNHELARDMVAAMGDRPLVVLRAHGITSGAATVAAAVLQAVSVDAIATLALRITASGGSLRDLPDEDLAQLPDLGGQFNTDTAWNHELARLRALPATPHA